MKSALSLACTLMIPALAATEPLPDFNTRASTSDPAATETVVVSATRTSRMQFTTPAAISVIDSDAIRLIQPYVYHDTFDALPSMNIHGGPRRIAGEPAIRGFSDEQVAIRVDGTRLNDNNAHGGRFLLDPALIESVEELRGSATAYASTGTLDALAHLTPSDVGEDVVDGRGNDILATRDETSSALVKLGYAPEYQRLELTLARFENTGRNPVNANDRAAASTRGNSVSTAPVSIARHSAPVGPN